MKQVSCFLTVLAITFFMSSVVSAQVTAVTVTEEGNVGIGTTTPGFPLTIRAQRTGEELIGFEDLDGTPKWHINQNLGGTADGLNFVETFVADGRLFLKAGGNVGIGTTNPNHPLEMGSGAHVTVGGVWTDASSRAFKENIQHLTIDAALSALEALEPVQYNYKVDPDDNHLGFIAEDVPDLVASKNRKGMSPMDVVAVLTKVVQ